MIMPQQAKFSASILVAHTIAKMKFSLVVSALVSVVLASDPEPCSGSGNNCQRNVAGTNRQNPPFLSRSAECVSAPEATFVPEPTTYTDFVYDESATEPITVTAASTPASTIFPEEFPTYASYCDDSAEYYSACSCAGWEASTTTLEPAEVTEIVYSDCAGARMARRATQAIKRRWATMQAY